MSEEWARGGMRECEYFGFGEERKGERVERRGPNVLSARRTERGKLRYEVGSGSTGEGDGQNLLRDHAILEEATDAAHESVRLDSAGPRNNAKRASRIGCDL